jgi:hypothetical protein
MVVGVIESIRDISEQKETRDVLKNRQVCLKKR